MKDGSKEFYDAQAFFERESGKYHLSSLRFEKEKRSGVPVGYWYEDGKTNDAFRMFLFGAEYARSIAAQENIEGPSTAYNTASLEIAAREAVGAWKLADKIDFSDFAIRMNRLDAALQLQA
jgi:hypothetical protein